MPVWICEPKRFGVHIKTITRTIENTFDSVKPDPKLNSKAEIQIINPETEPEAEFKVDNFEEYTLNLAKGSINAKNVKYLVNYIYPPYNTLFVKKEKLNRTNYYTDGIQTEKARDNKIFFSTIPENMINYDLIYHSAFKSYPGTIKTEIKHTSEITIKPRKSLYEAGDWVILDINIGNESGSVEVDYCGKIKLVEVDQTVSEKFEAGKNCKTFTASYTNSDGLTATAKAVIGIKQNYKGFFVMIFSLFLLIAAGKAVWHYHWRNSI